MLEAEKRLFLLEAIIRLPETLRDALLLSDEEGSQLPVPIAIEVVASFAGRGYPKEVRSWREAALESACPLQRWLPGSTYLHQGQLLEALADPRGAAVAYRQALAHDIPWQDRKTVEHRLLQLSA